MKKMLEKFVHKRGPYAVIEEVQRICERDAVEAAELSKKHGMEIDGFALSRKLHMVSRAIKKCLGDIHRQNTAPFWVGGKKKWWQ